MRVSIGKRAGTQQHDGEKEHKRFCGHRLAVRCQDTIMRRRINGDYGGRPLLGPVNAA